MELVYEKTKPEDAETIFAMSKDLIDRYEDMTSIDYHRVLNWMRRKIEMHIEEYVAIFADGRKAGFYRFFHNGQMMELDDLYILPEFRCRGIGTQIIQKCCAEAQGPVMLYVFAKNTGALSLYRSLGFEITEHVGASRHIMVRYKELL